MMAIFVVVERVGYLMEAPMENSILDLPLNRFCCTITADLLGETHPLARHREDDRASVWM